jgi:hypothetical protein
LRPITLAELIQPNQIDVAEILRLDDLAHPIKCRVRKDAPLDRRARAGGIR